VPVALPPSADSSFVGARAWSARVSGFSLARWFSKASHYSAEPHGHSDGHLMFYIGGRYITEAHGDIAGPSNPLVFNPRGTYHSDRPVSGGGSFFTVTIHDDERTSELPLPTCPTVVARPDSRRLVHLIMRASADQFMTGIDFEALCLELFSSIEGDACGEQRPPQWMSRSMDLLLDSLEEPRSIASIAENAQVDPAHFVRTFRRHFGCTPGEYRRVARLQAAATELTQTRRSIVEIALNSGFADQSHFTKAFHKWVGVSPGAYRRLTTT
jgi:AraC family transcriptional regulator